MDLEAVYDTFSLVFPRLFNLFYIITSSENKFREEIFRINEQISAGRHSNVHVSSNFDFFFTNDEICILIFRWSFWDFEWLTRKFLSEFSTGSIWTTSFSTRFYRSHVQCSLCSSNMISTQPKHLIRLLTLTEENNLCRAFALFFSWLIINEIHGKSITK